MDALKRQVKTYRTQLYKPYIHIKAVNYAGQSDPVISQNNVGNSQSWRPTAERRQVQDLAIPPPLTSGV
jgi:hypothetical protein